MAASMALQVVVSPFLGVLFDNLKSPISKEVDLLRGVDQELKKLTGTISYIQAVLEDAETKQLSNKAIADWLLKLKDAAYDADDILDECATQALQLESGSLLSRFSFEQIKFRHKIGKRMKEINQRFDDIASQSSKFGLREGVVESRVEIYPNRITSSIPTDSEIYGREEDTSYIVRWLLNNTDSQEDLSICSILGMGGLGKTTVAQSVYNDNKVTKHFDIKIWVCVSTDFDLTKLTKAVLDSIPGASCSSEQLDPLQRHLQESLNGKRFLIVLDDIWNENQEEWDRFKFSLKCGAKGSSAIVTTRLPTVALITGTCPPYFLKCLSKEDCWSLFKRRAFGTGNEERQALVDIGKEIVKKGGGVPLAAKVLGSLMRFKSEESEWLYVRDSKIWDLPLSNENTIMPALRLSYTHLSPHLRQCFAYCSLFPQDFRMRKEEVIFLWMANGLIQPREGMKLEDIGNGILNSLVWRSLFQVKEKDDEGNVESFVMHDLVHDLSCCVAKNECCHIDGSHQIQHVPNETRHLLVNGYIEPSSSIYKSIHQSAPKLRTLLCKNVNISTFKCLRALTMSSLSDSIPSVTHESIGNLKHLRYLDLSYNKFRYLPKSICGLRNLQTLKLKGCSWLQVLPKCLSNLRSLRHLNIKECDKLSEMPIDMGKMTCLQTLSWFVVGANKGRGIKELERMDSLTGELEIKCLENVKSGRDAEYANLMKKKGIKTLRLTWSRHTEEEKEREVIEGLQPDSNLRKLKISEYKGIGFPSWLEYSTLPNLVEIYLNGCARCELLPSSLSRLPLLKTLQVGGMPRVKFLFHSEDEDIYGDDMVNRFSSLEKLSLDNMSELEEWCSFRGKGGGGGEGQMFLPPRLKNITVAGCPKLKIVQWSPSLESLNMIDCDDMMLESLKNLPCLSFLDIGYFKEVTYFPEGSLRNLTALQSLHVQNFKQLKILPKELGDLCKLTALTIEDCNELVSLPEEMRNLSSIKTLKIGECNKLESLPEVGRSSLTRLWILRCERMKNLSVVLSGCQTVLQNLVITKCPNLEWESIKFVHLIALRDLDLTMTSLPDQIIQNISSTVLRSLSINNCPNLESVEFAHLLSLQWLRFQGFSSLPNRIHENLSSTLQTLYFSDSNSMISLPEWIGSLTELRYLDIISCKELRMLPEGLRHLTKLVRLSIVNCHPELHKRCKSRKGKDWHKISHIPDLYIKQDSKFMTYG